MLVLSRRPQESVVINENIRVRIIKVVGTRVYLGIEAPRDVTVRRSELKPRENNSGHGQVG